MVVFILFEKFLGIFFQLLLSDSIDNNPGHSNSITKKTTKKHFSHHHYKFSNWKLKHDGFLSRKYHSTEFKICLDWVFLEIPQALKNLWSFFRYQPIVRIFYDSGKNDCF